VGPAGDVVCYCFDVTRAVIRTHMAKPGNTVETLVAETRVGTKCTACLLDVDLVLGQIHAGASARGLSPLPDEAPLRSFFTHAHDFTDSGFFVNDSAVSTTVRIANWGPMLERFAGVVPMRGIVRIFGADGRLHHKRPVRIEPQTDFSLAFGEIAGLPRHGWFHVSLAGQSPGIMGSIRPQVMLRGRDWIATYHTQPHAMACRYKAVLIRSRRGRLGSAISVVNQGGRANDVKVSLSTLEGQAVAEFALRLPGLGADLVDLDAAFDRIPDEGAFFVGIHSERPTRKHIVNRHATGTWSVDHFPNQK